MHIRIEHSESALWGTVDPIEDGYNERESVESYNEHLEAAVYDAYPTAEIEIVVGINDKVTVDGETDHDEVPWIDQIVERVWNGDWQVFA